MALSKEMLRELIALYVGAEFDDAELERLRPVVERHFARISELQRIDVGGDDPRTMDYIYDGRLQG